MNNTEDSIEWHKGMDPVLIKVMFMNARAKRFRLYRELAGIRYEQARVIVGVTQLEYQEMESGVRPISRDQLMLMRKQFIQWRTGEVKRLKGRIEILNAII